MMEKDFKIARDLFLCYEIVHNVSCKSIDNLGHTETSIKELIKEEVKEKKPNYILDEKELNILYRGYLVYQKTFMLKKLIGSLNINHEKEEVEALSFESAESLISEYDYDISQIELLLDIKIDEKDLINNCDDLLTKFKVNLINSNDVIDLRRLQGYFRQETLNAKNSIFRFADVIVAGINYIILKTYFDKIPPNNRQRNIKLKIKELDKIQGENEQVAQNIKLVLSSIKSKIELPLVFDSVIDKYGIDCRHLSKSKERIELFDIPCYKENLNSYSKCSKVIERVIEKFIKFFKKII